MAKNFNVSLPIGVLPELHNQPPALYQDFVDIHSDLLNIAQAIQDVGTGAAAGGEDISPNDWENWPMNYLHKMLVSCGEAINKGDVLRMGSNSRAYKYAYGDDNAWSYNPPIFATRDIGSDILGIALSAGIVGGLVEVMCFGAYKDETIVEMAPNPLNPNATQLGATGGAADRPTSTSPVVPQAGNIFTGRGSGIAAGNGIAYYLGNKWVMVTGGKWSP